MDNATNWPKHPDGTNKRVGEMTLAERAAVMADARTRFAAQSEVNAGRIIRHRKVSGFSALRVGAVAGREF
ncbi:hypothetical protein [Xanthobacter flavus]|uniref:hypothetical protein n=1 Tax=Xanthobacter flavus TaxID=281 RepID=UPI0037286A48